MNALQTLQANIAYIEDCLVDIDKRAEGVLDTDAKAAFDAGMEYLGNNNPDHGELTGAYRELADLKARADVVAKIQAGAGQRADFNVITSPTDITDINVRTASTQTVRDAANRAIERADRGYLGNLSGRADMLDRLMNLGETGDFSADLVTRSIVATSNPHYETAFLKGINGQSAMWTVDEQKAMREAQNASLTVGEGGYGVPTLVDPTVIITSGATGNALIDAAHTIPVTSSTWNGVASGEAVWSMDAEGAEVSDDSTTFTQPSITMEKPQAWIPYTIELNMDYPGWAAQMGRLITHGYRTVVASQAAVGTGSSPQTTGLFVGATTTIDVGTDNTFVATDVDATYAAVPEDWRMNGIWVMDVSVENAIRAFGSGTATSRFTVDQTADGITLLNGKRVILSDHAPTLAATTDASKHLAFGDPEYFIIGQRLGMTLTPVEVVFGSNQRPTGKSGLYGTARFGTGVSNVAAWRVLKNITT